MRVLFAVFLLLSPGTTDAQTDEVPGTTGWGLTVFQGSEPDTFGIVTIGTTSTGATPSCNRILVRLTGEKAESTGVAAGMSGSPVYIGSRLIGALSSTFPFLEEPLGLVTPLECMLDTDEPAGSAAPARDACRPMSFIAPGFGTESLEELIGAMGWTGSMVHSDMPSGSTDGSVNLKPGSPAAVVLVNGDWNLAALGTVTWREGDDIVAFGHPFLNLGSVEFPLAGARVTAVIPSRSLAFKIGTVGAIAGTVVFDGSNGIRATTAKTPPIIPVHITIGDEAAMEFNLGLAMHPVVTPLLIRTTILNCYNRTRYSGMENTRVRMTAHLESDQKREITRMDRGPRGPARIAAGLSQTVEAVMNCPLGKVKIDSLTFAVSTDTHPREYWLHSVEIYPVRSMDGKDSVRLRTVILDARGERFVRTIGVVVPTMIDPTRMEVRIGDGPSTMEWERERAPLKHVASSTDEYLDLLFSPWDQDKLYIQIVVNKGSWTRRRGEVAGLPGSMAKVLSRAVQAGGHDYVQKSVIARTEIAFDGPVHGQVILHPHGGDGAK